MARQRLFDRLMMERSLERDILEKLRQDHLKYGRRGEKPAGHEQRLMRLSDCWSWRATDNVTVDQTMTVENLKKATPASPASGLDKET